VSVANPILVLLRIVCYVLFVAIFVRVIFSWTGGPNPSNRIYRFVYDITEPVLRPVRNLMPGGGMGMDFSPMIVSFILILILNVIDRSGG